jgi:SAM-dependent methyltransferase
MEAQEWHILTSGYRPEDLAVKVHPQLSDFPSASPADARRWQLVHDVTYRVDRRHFWHVVRNERIFKMLRWAVPNLKEKSYLEIGCGVGNVLGYLFDHGVSNCVGWDINNYSLEIARRRYPHAKFFERDFLRPSDSNELFDVTGMFDVLEHFPDDVAILKSVKSLLKPGGTVVLTVPAHSVLWSAYDDFFGHYRRYDKHQLLNVLQRAGFINPRALYMMASLAPVLWLSRQRLSGKSLSDCDLEQSFERESSLPNPLLNEIAKSVLRMEHALLGRNDLSFGATLVATASRPHSEAL